MSNSNKKQVAVVGGGVSGLATAWHLHANCPDIEVHLFEADSRLGGHALTMSVPGDNGDNKNDTKDVDVDVGFMVFNDDN
jgi:predicted NAD/FAD-binding protein